MAQEKAIGWERLWRDEEIAKQWAERPPLPEVIEMADRLERDGRRRVLDIGCGMGRHTLYLAARGFDVTATDNAPTAIAACKKNLEEAGLRATLVECDMAELPFEDNSFDGVVASHVIHHTNRATLERIIALITRQLAPGGIFVWVTPTSRHCEYGRGQEIEPGTWVNPEHREGPVPHHYSTEEEARELLRAYEIESICEHEYVKEEGRYTHWRILARKR